MRKVILFIASSLDNYIARENGDVSWLFMDADYGYKKFYQSIDTVIMGRKTYEKSKEFEQEPFKGKRCIVFSRKAKSKNDMFVGDPIVYTKRLKNTKGKNIWLVGGSEIITVFMNNRLIDEIVVSIHPIVLGKGIPLFRDIVPEVKLTLKKKIVYKNGLAQLHYQVQN